MIWQKNGHIPKIKKFILGNPTAIYDYVIKDGERPDTIANAYYGDSNFVWLIFLANDVVDPYYDWPLTQQQFKDFIIEKYGSIEAAKLTVSDSSLSLVSNHLPSLCAWPWL